MQHAIYARAVEEQTGGRVTKSGYFFPTPRGAGARLIRECSEKELKDTLNLIFDVIGSGYFPHASAEACRFCDFQNVCGSAEVAASRADRKFSSNPSHPGVDAWLKLQQVR